MFEHDRAIPRAYTLPGIPHQTASTLGITWALQQAKALSAPVSLYAPGKQNINRTDYPAIDALIRAGVPLHTWRDWHSGHGVVIALWPDEKHLLHADESPATKALVAVTWSPRSVLGWAQAKGAISLGGDPAEHFSERLDPVVVRPSTACACWSDNKRQPTSATAPPWPKASPSSAKRDTPSTQPPSTPTPSATVGAPATPTSCAT